MCSLYREGKVSGVCLRTDDRRPTEGPDRRSRRELFACRGSRGVGYRSRERRTTGRTEERVARREEERAERKTTISSRDPRQSIYPSFPPLAQPFSTPLASERSLRRGTLETKSAPAVSYETVTHACGRWRKQLGAHT